MNGDRLPRDIISELFCLRVNAKQLSAVRKLRHATPGVSTSLKPTALSEELRAGLLITQLRGGKKKSGVVPYTFNFYEQLKTSRRLAVNMNVCPTPDRHELSCGRAQQPRRRTMDPSGRPPYGLDQTRSDNQEKAEV